RGMILRALRELENLQIIFPNHLKFQIYFRKLRNMKNASLLERINKSALNFLVPLTPEETYPIIVNEALKLTSSEFGSILLRDKRKLKRVYGSSKFAYSIRNR